MRPQMDLRKNCTIRTWLVVLHWSCLKITVVFVSYLLMWLHNDYICFFASGRALSALRRWGWNAKEYISRWFYGIIAGKVNIWKCYLSDFWTFAGVSRGMVSCRCTGLHDYAIVTCCTPFVLSRSSTLFSIIASGSWSTKPSSCCLNIVSFLTHWPQPCY